MDRYLAYLLWFLTGLALGAGVVIATWNDRVETVEASCLGQRLDDIERATLQTAVQAQALRASHAEVAANACLAYLKAQR